MAAIQCTQAEMEQRARTEIERRNQRNDINQMMAVAFAQCSAEGKFLELTHPIADWETNVFGTLHGGLIALLLDATMAIASRAYTGDQMTPTLDIHVNFLRPVPKGELVRTRATIVHVGRSVIQINGELWIEERSNLCAAADAIFYRADQNKK